MNTTIAVTGEVCKTAVLLAGIWAGQRFALALVPQLRVAAPKTGKQGGTSEP